ncbi:hypothetical protein APHAL10511_006124 [Amanita phalloides]|nr:hypothetical protein APHAL10511_006124 [Amanita phalloides]
MASTSANVWPSIPDDELTVEVIKGHLEPVQDDLWVAATCVDRTSDNVDIQRMLLQVGLTRTSHAVERCRVALDTNTLARQSNKDNLSRHFRTVESDAWLCCIRAILLERLDRLNTYVELCKERPAEQTELDEGLEEWEDDPWADGVAEVELFTAGPPMTLSTFLTDDLLCMACQLATEQWFGGVHLLLEKHSLQLYPHRFRILDRIPEHAHPATYRELLPALDHTTGEECIAPHKSWRDELDLAESSELREALHTCNVSFIQVTPILSDGKPFLKPLSAVELVQWYMSRVDSILNSTGMVDVALTLVQHGASQGIQGLDEVGEELTLLSRLVYDAPHSQASQEAIDWTLDKWYSMDPPSVIRAYLAHSTPATLSRDVMHLVLPYLFVLEARAERYGSPDPFLPNRLLYEYIISAPLEMVAAIFESSKPTLPMAQRLIRDEEDMARLALTCLYGSGSLTEWSTMSRIFECLPAWNLDNIQDPDEDEADTTISSLGAFMAPSTSRLEVTTQGLLVFFTPLHLSSLSRALDILDVHLESGEILARWSVPAPLRWFLRSSSDVSEQRSWANRMARRAGGSEDQLKSLDDWEWLLEDMLKLAGKGDAGLRGAFGLLSKDEVARIFLSGLLSTGNFAIAKTMLHSSRKLPLDPVTLEDICLSCSRELYDNASSGNYKFGDMKVAYDCLDVPPASERIIKEKEFIEATSRICSFNVMSRPGIPISPIEIRLTKDRLALVSRVLSSNSEAFKHTEVILDLCYKLGFHDDIVAEVKVLAMLADSALQSEDFECAFEANDRMVAKLSSLRDSISTNFEDPRILEAKEVCWVACFQLGRQLEFDQLDKKLSLLGYALEFCPADKLHDIIAVWRRLEKEDIAKREERLSHRLGRQSTSSEKRRKRISSMNVASSLRARLQEFHMPSPPLLSTPDAAALATKTFQTVAANFPFSVGSRGRSFRTDTDSKGSRSSSNLRFDADDVSTQATRVISKGIGWLIGTGEDY